MVPILPSAFVVGPLQLTVEYGGLHFHSYYMTFVTINSVWLQADEKPSHLYLPRYTSAATGASPKVDTGRYPSPPLPSLRPDSPPYCTYLGSRSPRPDPLG